MKRILIAVLLIFLFCQSCTMNVKNKTEPIKEIELSDCLLWKREKDYGCNYEESLIENNVLYISSDVARGSYLIATDLLIGNEKWRFVTNSDRLTNLVIENGKIYFGSSYGFLYALNKDTGKEIWKYKSPSEIYVFIYLHNNSVIFRDYTYNIYSIDTETGEKIWQYNQTPPLENGEMLDRGPVYNSGIIFFKNKNKKLIGLDANNGIVRWSISDTFEKDYSFESGYGMIYCIKEIVNDEYVDIAAINLQNGKEVFNKRIPIDTNRKLDIQVYFSGGNAYLNVNNKTLYGLDGLTGVEKVKLDLQKYNIEQDNNERATYEKRKIFLINNDFAYFIGAYKKSGTPVLFIIDLKSGKEILEKRLGIHDDYFYEQPTDNRIYLRIDEKKLLVLDLSTGNELKKVNVGFNFEIVKVNSNIILITKPYEFSIQPTQNFFYAINLR